MDTPYYGMTSTKCGNIQRIYKSRSDRVAFALKFSKNEKRVIRILSHSSPGPEPYRLFSHQEVADLINCIFREYNKGTRTRRGIYGYLKSLNDQTK